jgi:hypothetical protein
VDKKYWEGTCPAEFFFFFFDRKNIHLYVGKKKIEPGQAFRWDLGFCLNAYKNMYMHLGEFPQAPNE